ncbi:hypothetical protein DRJ17_05830 [Candidatus Woesearchaeota archaeon]|nr:MAG: hypothetical protein DRJ17_05830 [Candidatus Woesearchaeota archaeon]
MIHSNQTVTQSSSELLQSALAYASFGWAVFPVHSIRNGRCTCGRPACTSPGKHPLTRHGFKDATTDPAVIAAWWKKYPWANIAIATGEISGRLLVIDIDNKPENGAVGEETWQEINQGHPDTVEVITGGGGRHLYFTYPEEVELKSGTNVLGPGVDIRADNGYVLAPPSLHLSGRRYEWEASSDPLEGIAVAPAPPWSLNGYARLVRPTVKPSPPVELLPAAKVQELRSALAFINSDDRDVWLKVGMALKSTRAGQQAYGIWTEWSQQSTKYDPRDQQRTWQSLDPNGSITISTIFWLAKQNGWIEQCVEVHPTDTSFMPQMHGSKEFYNPPGVLGDIVRFILDTASFPQPAYALNAALTLVGTILGRRVCTETGLRTNLYLISVGETGSGKEHPRKVVRKIFNAADIPEYNGGESLGSGQALLTRLSMTPCVLFQIDEFGQLMQSIQLKNTARYNLEIMTNLMKLYSSADAEIIGTEYANQLLRPRTKISYPCCSLHASATPETFYDAVTSKHVISGYLNRFVVVDVSNQPMPLRQRRCSVVDIPQTILMWINKVIYMRSGGDGPAVIDPAQPIVVRETAEATNLFDRLEAKIRERTNRSETKYQGDLWKRVWENAAKIALICACADDIDNPVINVKHAEWAIKFVTYHTKKLAEALFDKIADSPFEKSMNDFYQSILTAGDRGVTERDMNRYKPFCSYPPKDRQPMLQTLLNAEKIALTKVKMKGAGRPRIAYVALRKRQGEEDDDASK